ncbi:helix-turn-helix domain-containing protein [Hymenobacter negativus]|uniref:AraC family transcriptional regulator n=1 Tax=Hymenobacter negativus TaxID=2795026 RepID=A0ABS3QMA9_9BACT|nr:helix-turn-helix domain-containing protein [Hymenobacter negativus]MBO2012231.1 AraC family transcriptional regulator [Hymenobacter negativus]
MNLSGNTLRLPAQTLFELHPLACFQPKANQPVLAQPHIRPFQYTIVLVEEDQSFASTVSLAAGLSAISIHFIGPGQLARAHTTDQTGTVLQFTDEFFCQEGDMRDVSLTNSLFYCAVEESPLRVSGTESGALVFLINGLKRESESLGLRKEALVRTYLKAFLIHCLRLREELAPIRAQSAAGSLFLRFRGILEEHYTVLRTVTEYADRLHVTANHLSETIKKETGRTAGSHIRHRIIAEAQRLADSSCLTLKEIAYQLGYDDVAHFSRLFKRCVGLNFSQYKGQLIA